LEIKKVIITGGPSTGKTSLISKLEELGHVVQQEKSRDIIKESLANNSDVLPWDNLIAFSEKVIFQRQQQFELCKSIDKNISFFDRGIPDVLAYLDCDNIEIPEHFLKIAKNVKYYSTVFITPAWEEIYITDNERREDFSKAVELMSHIEKTYLNLGYNVVFIPKDTIENRIKFILNNLNLH
jgi:predicted ATPase